MGIEMSKRALQQFQTALSTTGHNISNVSTEGYSRQRVVMRTLDPLYEPSLNRPEKAGQLGQGMEITDIQRVRDEFIDKRINFEKSSLGYWQMRDNYLTQMEAVHNEPSALNLRSDLDAFWVGWQEVANNPSEMASRSALVEKSQRVATSVNHIYDQFKDLRDNANLLIETKVRRINEIAHSLRDFNERILKSQAMGDNPNDLLDKRDLLIEELSTLADVSVANKDPDETIIYIGSRHLVQGELVSELETVRDAANGGYFGVRWKIDGVDTKFNGGEMKGLLEIRDKDLVHSLNMVNSFAQNLSDAVNAVHRNGFGLNQATGIDFFKSKPLPNSATGAYDLNGDGTLDHTVLFRVTGINKLNPKDAVGVSGVMTFDNVKRDGARVTIDYKPEDTVETVMQRINNSNANVTASLDDAGKLAVKARVFDDYSRPNFVITHLEDSGEFLAGISGVLKEAQNAGAYDWNTMDAAKTIRGDGRFIATTPLDNPAAYLAVNDVIKNDMNYIAAAKGIDTKGTGTADKTHGAGDNSNALSIASLRFKEVMVDSKATFNDYYAGIVADLGAKAETSNVELQKGNAVMDHLGKIRQSVSGVNLDEEMAQMVAYQHGYNAAARVISMMDKLLETVITRMGV